jgi:hypothetical protein
MAGLALARRRPRGPSLLASAMLFTLAFLTKQSALVGPLAVGLWLLASGGAWLRFGLLTGGLLAGTLALGSLLTGGGFWLHIVVFQQLPWSIGQLRHQFDKLIDSYPWLLLAGGLALMSPLLAPSTASAVSRPPPAVRRGRLMVAWRGPLMVVWPPGLVLWYLLAALLAVLVANGRVGINYSLLLDLLPPLCLIVAVGLARLVGSGWPLAGQAAGRWSGSLVGAGLSLLLMAQALLPNPPGAWYSANRMPSPERAARMRAIAAIVEQTPGRILSEDLWLLLRVGKPIEYDDPFLMAQSAQRGLWNERRFIADLEAQRFALVLLEYDLTGLERSPRWTPAALAALRANYEILHKDVIFIHRPRSLLSTPGTRQTIDLGGQLRLTESAVSTSRSRPGGTIRLMLRWSRLATPTADYMVFIHLVDATGNLRGQLDFPPSGRPTRAWAAGERAEGEYALTVPETAPSGRYRLLVGLYDPATGQRLTTGTTGDSIALAEIEIE